MKSEETGESGPNTDGDTAYSHYGLLRYTFCSIPDNDYTYSNNDYIQLSSSGALAGQLYRYQIFCNESNVRLVKVPAKTIFACINWNQRKYE